jgi:hypothetical protein
MLLQRSPSDLRRLFSAHEQCGRRKNRDEPGKYELVIRGAHPLGPKMPRPITGKELPRQTPIRYAIAHKEGF